MDRSMTKLASKIRWISTVVVGMFVWLGGCSSSSKEGITLTVEIEAPRSPAVVAGTRTFDTDRSVLVTLTRGFLSTGAVEIFGCTAAGSSWRWVEPLRLHEARAHVVGSPTVLGIPAIESLLATADTRMKVGDLHPPQGTYCKVKQSILAADQDALGLPADGTMVGKSLLVEGTYLVAGGSAQGFRFTSTASFDVETTIDETSLAIDGTRSATLVLVKASDRWFDGVDFGADEHDVTLR
ncbi:MAG: putative lipoprotein, partial [Labilithrix sp.]|nr:putative lipoprotein [Labilithrix sp.]